MAKLPDVTPITDDFDPRDYRDPSNPIKTWMAYFNFLRSGFGTGMLSMPLAISQTGMVLGPILLVFFGCLLMYTHMTLLWCLNEISRQLTISYISYRYGFRLALLRGPPLFRSLGNIGPHLIATFMILSQLAICTTCVIFTAESLRDIMDWEGTDLATFVLVLPYIILQISMKSLHSISYISLFGTLLNIIGLFIVFYQIFKEPPRKQIIYINHGNYAFYAFGIGNFLFNNSFIGVVLALDKVLINPKIMTNRCGVITFGFSIITVVGTAIGICAYWTFSAMDDNVLRYISLDENSAMTAIGLYSISVTFAYPLQCYPAIQILLEVVKNYNPTTAPSDASMKIVEFVARPIFVFITFGICYFMPHQGPFVAFTGHLCTSLLAIVFPSLMELSLRYPSNYGIHNVHFFKCVGIIALGLFSWIFGGLFSGYMLYIRILSTLPVGNEHL